MPKQAKVPLLLKIIRWWFPKLEAIAPPLATRLFVQLFFTPLHYGFPHKELEWLNNATKNTITVNGKKIQCYSWGDEKKPAVLFVHGWAGRATQFRKFFPVFMEAGFRVIAFDAHAHGKSEGKRTNLPEFSNVLKEVFQTFGEPDALIAHSFGGVASMYATTQGLPVKKLINIGTPVIGDLIIKTFLDAVNGSAKTVERFKEYMIKKYGRTFHEFTIQYFIPRIERLPRLMLVHDEDDKDVSIEHPMEASRLYPDAWLYKTKGLGHTRILKDEIVINDCLKFIQSPN